MSRRIRVSVPPSRTLSFFIFVFIAAVRPVVADDVVRLAGTFNQWATEHDDWRMERVDDQTLRFVNFWACGRYDFKFVINGSWDRHFGSAGGNRLDQPGGDITLVIPESGVYEIVLDPQGRSWRIDKTLPKQIVPVLDIQKESSRSYLLDATRSIFPDAAGARNANYTFEVKHDGEGTPYQIKFMDAKRSRLHLEKPVAVRIRLTVGAEGVESRTVEVERKLGDGFDLIRGNELPTLVMLAPLSDHRWGVVLLPEWAGDSLVLVGFSLPTPKPITIPDQLKNRPVLLTVDDRTNDIAMNTEGWHEFVLDVRGARSLRDVTVEAVHLIGDFNGWRADATPMRRGDDERYRTALELPDGVHHYKFLVNGTIFVEDPAADVRFRVSDGNGGFNSGLLIGDDAAKIGEPKSDHVNINALKHDPQNVNYFAPIASNVARFSVRTLANDVRTVELRFADRTDALPLRKSSTQFGFDYWSTQAVVPSDTSLKYSFVLADVEGDTPVLETLRHSRVVLGSDGGVSALDPKLPSPFEVTMPAKLEAPDWAKRAVWYQIFPERFRNGEPSNDPPRTVPWSHAWEKPYKPKPTVVKGSPQDFEEKGSFFEFIFDRRYGGDLQGVREKLPYLRDLGITAIYFNPIFQAESLHKYDASDYRHIDDRFGVAGSLDRIQGETTDPATWQWSDTDKLFLDFLNEAHRQGFKVILDGVFNHTGRDFWAFQDILKNGKNSPYGGWFEINSWNPLDYQAWDKPNGSLPKLKHNEALGLAVPVREHLFAVTRRWMDPNGDGDPSDGIDGWRLDVASDINANFWRDWRKLVKEINPDAYIVAELWQESREWLDGTTFDAVMNYPFARRTIRFVVNDKKASTPSQFKDEIAEMLSWYRMPVYYALQNLYDSHDTDRIASMCMNPDLEYDRANRLQDNGPSYIESKPTPACYERVKLLATMQMMFLGAPMVYYGDEAGLHGADDPSDRKPMLWPDLLPYDDADERIEPDVLEHYRRMIAIRNSQPALQLGSYEPILTDDANRLFAFSRTLGDDVVIVVVNNSDVPRTATIAVPWTDVKRVVRLDDADQCELVMPNADDPTTRPMIRPLANRPETGMRIENGELRGLKIAPRAAAILGSEPRS